MSNQTPHTTGNRAGRPRRVASKSARPPAGKPTPQRVRPSSPRASAPVPSPSDDALRALLADPASIARGDTKSVRRARPSPSTPPGADPKSPGGSSSEAPAFPPTPPSPTPAGNTTAPAPARTARTSLLDATRAQRLAREARLRERESREALALARETYEPPTPPLPARLPAVDAVVPSAREEGAGWQRVALKPPAKVAPTPSAPISAPAAQRALAAELREARATLAIARETTQVQRDELAILRQALAETRAELAARASERAALPAPIENPAELSRLRDRVAALEREEELAAAERQQLLQRIAGQDEELALRARRLEALQERFEVQEQALDQARRQGEQERRRHTEAQALLERLRGALRGLDPEPAERPASVLEIVHVERAAEEAPASAPALAPEARPEKAGAEASREPAVRAPIFDFWRTEQIRRNFGPLGIDGVADLLRQPLEQRATRGGVALPIVLVGRGSASIARALADELLRAETAPFVLHVADPAAADRVRRLDDDPLIDTLRRHTAPETPAALAALLDSLSPAVVVCRDFLTWQADVDPWLSAFEACRARGACLVFLEETGHGEVAPGPDVVTVGQRIWELLPERYTRDPKTGETIGHFREAFVRRPVAPRNALLQRLRQHFELELCAQFGFLAEAFVSGPIAGCFDARAARDQRFLKQITDLDERRLESGSAAALHLVARVDPRPER